MRVAAVFCIAVVTTAASGRADPPKDDADREKLQGVWKIVASVGEADKITPEAGGKMIVSGDQLSLAIGDRKESFGYKLNSTKTPKWLDLVADKTTVVPCIYELDGDALRIRFPKGGKERATEFEPKKDSSNVRLLSLRRIK
ncbi:MAG TPA: TIGR03067 domain-containing protein [Urbifossiella sp.]|jgi:uncharacterized protein (TIGR03067 family)|nr:TIGR03067 domain-containing protein [Urbifossiella sp.]